MMRFDLALFKAIRYFWGANRAVDAFGVFLANILTYLLAIGAAFFMFKHRLFLELPAAFILSRLVLAELIAMLVKRGRPFTTLDFVPPFTPLTAGSFPSGHAASLFAVSIVIFLADPVWGTVYLVLSSLIVMARVFVGVHWLSDVLAGALIGLGAGYLVHWLFLLQ